jgi:hypothetical protein
MITTWRIMITFMPKLVLGELADSVCLRLTVRHFIVCKVHFVAIGTAPSQAFSKRMPASPLMFDIVFVAIIRRKTMRNAIKTLTIALSGAALVTTAMPGVAEARPAKHVYKVCRKSSGTTGLIAGGAAGAVVGSKVIGGGIVGPAVGAVGGALGGRAIDRTITAKQRCHYETRS